MSNEAIQNILIVDDSAASLKMAAHLIARPGRELYLAMDGEQALALAAKRDYDLFLLDVAMPGMTGFELCARLKADPRWTDTPVIFLTAIQDESSLVRGFELGAADYVHKPFNPQEFNARVDTQLKLVLQRRELRAKIADLEQLTQQLDAFSHSASHDLKSPLFAINSYLGALRERHGQALSQDARDLLVQAESTGQRMARLVDGLLAFSRSTAELNLVPLDLSSIAEGIAGELRISEPSRRVEFEIQAGVLARGDSTLVGSILRNLLGNAWKYTSKVEAARIGFGSVAPATTRFEVFGHERLLFVSDNGAGFDQDQAERLFQPFRRLHSQRDFEGHGLGLATVKRIVARHNGRIWAEGRPGQGACFWFTLPAVPDGQALPGCR